MCINSKASSLSIKWPSRSLAIYKKYSTDLKFPNIDMKPAVASFTSSTGLTLENVTNASNNRINWFIIMSFDRYYSISFKLNTQINIGISVFIR